MPRVPYSYYQVEMYLAMVGADLGVFKSSLSGKRKSGCGLMKVANNNEF